MTYELYIDSLFCLNFTMNLYLLLLVNNHLHRPATRWKLLVGALLGGLGYCIMFILPVPYVVIKIVVMAIGLNGGILYFVFHPSSLQAFLKILKIMIFYSFLMGGGLYLLKNHVTIFRNNMTPISLLLVIGGLLWLFFLRFERKKKNAIKEPCRVIISNGRGSQVTVTAIVDTGNCLQEPISGKPVSVLEKDVFDRLWGEEDFHGFRAIPYKSVGCKNGIMKGYEVPEIIIEQDGIRKVCRNVYIGLSNVAISGTNPYRMLVHPALIDK